MFPSFKPSPFRFAPTHVTYEPDNLVVPPDAPRVRVRYIGERRLIEDNGIDGKLYLRRISVPREFADTIRQAIRDTHKNHVRLRKAERASKAPYQMPRQYETTPMAQLHAFMNYLFWHPSHCHHGYDCCGCSSQDWYTLDTVPGKRREFVVTISVTYNV